METTNDMKINNCCYFTIFKWSYLKKFENEILYPCCSAIPAQSMLAEAPYNVPLPIGIQLFFLWFFVSFLY